MSYYYWDYNFTTKNGLSLQQCIDLYGTKEVTIRQDKKTFKYKVIYLDEKKDLGHSWMLWYKDEKGDNIKLSLYENRNIKHNSNIKHNGNI